MTATIIVCPDCGQRYDPAKAAQIARVWSESTRRMIKPGRVEAQDVSTAAHRNGRHHRAHVEVTRFALDGWAPMHASGPRLSYGSFVWRKIDSRLDLCFAQIPDFESGIVELKDEAVRATCERIIRAAQAVRVDHPWWRAYLHELGVSPDVIALGLTIGNDNRGDVLFERRLPQVGQTLRGVT